MVCLTLVLRFVSWHAAIVINIHFLKEKGQNSFPYSFSIFSYILSIKGETFTLTIEILKRLGFKKNVFIIILKKFIYNYKGLLNL